MSDAEVMRDSLIAEVTYRLDDLYAVSFRAWRSWLRALIAIEVVYLVLPALFMVIDDAPVADFPNYWNVSWLGFAPAIVAVLLTISPLIGYWRSRRRKLLGPNQFYFEDKGIRVVNASVNSLVFWSAIKRVAISRSRLFLFISPASALILPRREFPSGTAFDRCVQDVLERVAMSRFESGA